MLAGTQGFLVRRPKQVQGNLLGLACEGVNLWRSIWEQKGVT